MRVDIGKFSIDIHKKRQWLGTAGGS